MRQSTNDPGDHKAMLINLFHDLQEEGPSKAAGYVPVPALLSEHIEALVWTRFEPHATPCSTRLMPHGGLLLVVGMANRGDAVVSPPVTHMGLRRLTDAQATLKTKATGCLTLFALLKPAGAMGLMHHARMGESNDDRWALHAMVGHQEERRLASTIERAASAEDKLLALAGWLEQRCLAAPHVMAERRLAHAVSLLHANPSLSLPELWNATGFGRRNLERKLRAWFGTSPREQQRFAKLQHSAKLAWQRLRAVDIALELGFSDQAHFSRTVSAMTGMAAGRFVQRMDTPLARAFRHATAGANLMPCSFESAQLLAAA